MHGHTRGHYRVAAVGDIREGAAMHKGGSAFKGLHQIGHQRIFEQGSHGSLSMKVACGHRLPVEGITNHNARQALFEVADGRRQAEHCHNLGSHRDVKAVLTRHTIGHATKAIHHVAQLAVVHIHAALPGDAARIEAQLIALLDMVVHHGSQQIVGGANGVKVSSKMKINILHGHHLSIAAASSPALNAKYRT